MLEEGGGKQALPIHALTAWGESSPSNPRLSPSPKLVKSRPRSLLQKVIFIVPRGGGDNCKQVCEIYRLSYSLSY